MSKSNLPWENWKIDPIKHMSVNEAITDGYLDDWEYNIRASQKEYVNSNTYDDGFKEDD